MISWKLEAWLLVEEEAVGFAWDMEGKASCRVVRIREDDWGSSR